MHKGMIDTVIARVGSHVFPCVGVRLQQQRRNRVHRGGENLGCGGGHGSILAAVEHEQGDAGDVANYSYYESTRLMQNSVIKPS